MAIESLKVNKKLIPGEQAGFRKERSCEEQVLTLTNHIEAFSTTTKDRCRLHRPNCSLRYSAEKRIVVQIDQSDTVPSNC